MRPFCCTHCDFGWVAEAKSSDCEFCGRPGFTTFLGTNRDHASITPAIWNMLFDAALRREKENI